jgi:predicted glycosyltransferase
VDEVYFEASDKEERVLFFLGDSDHDKRVLDNADFFRHFKMELLLGHYFFVKYEDDLAKLFNILHEPEEYVELIKSSSTVVTASAQTAVEARVTGAKVIYLDLGRETLYPLELLEKYGITIVKGFDTEGFDAALHSEIPAEKKKIEKIDISKINV